MADYEFRYAPLTGRLTGKQMIEQTEQAINQLSALVDSAAGQVEIISTLANEANENAATALETAEEALATTGRTYITVSTQTDANNYYDSQLIYIADSTSTNIPVADTGMLEVKTNDNKTACEQVFIADSSGDAYYRNGAITAETVGDVTTYTVTWGGWSSQPASQTYVQQELTNYLPLSGGTVSGDLTVTGNTNIDGYLPLAGGTMTGGIKFDATGEIGYRGTAHTSPYNPCKQLIVSATDIDHWGDAGGAKISLHTYDSTGTNTLEDGSFSLLATDGTNGNELKGKPDGTLNWSGYSIRLNGYNSNTAFFQLTNFSNVQKSNVDVGWSYDAGTGAGLGLRCASDELGNNAGEFFLFAKKGNTGCVLSGKPDGTLVWDGKAVVTVTASSINSGTGYIRFSNGLQICWGEATIASAGATVTLPAAFIDTNYRITEGRWWLLNWNESYYFADRTTTSFKRYAIGTLSSNSRVSMYIAIGKWK